MPVPLFDTAAPLTPLRAEIDVAIARVIDSGKFILGPEVEAFEREFAGYCGAGHAIGVANGNRCADHCPARARRRPGRRGRRALVHVLRQR
jgi:dTDP-4-amino-4,6-dideoxygalactose transaminase